MYKIYIKLGPGGRGKTKSIRPRLLGSYWDVQEFAFQLSAMHNSIKSHKDNNKLSDWYDIYFDTSKLDADDPTWLEI